MALKKFIGARYAPEFAGAWSNTKQYAALSVVYADNRSYVSRKTVPAGTPITNTEFWIQSSDWNAQVAEYNLKVEGYNANVEKYNKNVQDYSAAVSGFYADTLHSFDTKADMQADRTLALGETLLTCGDKKIGDGGGSFYQVVSETSVTAVALDNGLFAEPFEFQPYDYSQFQQEVEGYKNSTTRVYNTQQDMVADIGINAGNILMTTGALEQGDGQGSFWNVTDEQEEGSVLLQNGKYAKKFNVASVDASGTLLFNNKGNQVAIWGVKAGGETVNVPVSYSLGETKSVFVAVEYDSDNTNATVNLVVSGPVSFTKAFAWSDASVTSGQVKTVIYAVTLNSKGNSVYTGAQVAASYLTTLEKFIETLTVNVPNQSQALNKWNGKLTNMFTANFSVNTDLIIKNITIYPTYSITGIQQLSQFWAETPTTNGKITAPIINPAPATEPITLTLNSYLKTGNTHMNFYATSVNNSLKVRKAPAVNGNYGAFNFTSGNFQGKITYFAVSPETSTPYSIGNANAAWSGEKSNRNTAKFTVSRECILHSYTINSNDTNISTNITSEYGGFIGTDHTTAGIITYEPNMLLTPGVKYELTFSGTSFSEQFAAPASISGSFGPITFTGESNFYQGTMAIIDI
nr:MAG TPA: hypothetical protein [Caudoviricetes sp.]